MQSTEHRWNGDTRDIRIRSLLRYTHYYSPSDLEPLELLCYVTGAIQSGQYGDIVLRSTSPTVCGGPGGIAVLPCEISSGDVVKIRWFFGSTELSYSDEKYTFRSNELVVYGLEAGDIGTYRCNVKGENGDVELRTVVLRDDCELI